MYCKLFIVDEACTVNKGLSLTSDNYKSAVYVLKERFANTQVIILANMANMSLRSVSFSHGILGLQKIYDASDIQTRSSVLFDLNMDHYGSIMAASL